VVLDAVGVAIGRLFGTTPEVSRGHRRARTAPGDRALGLALSVPGVGDRWVNMRTAPDGRFAFRAADVPPRAGWTLADVRAGRVELEQDGGHRTVISWRLARAGGTVPHLPWLARGQ
jgi:hypothetical protein